jgi:ER membrane protein complex subunit 3
MLATAPKPLDAKAMREQRSLLHGVNVRSNYHTLSKRSFVSRRDTLISAYESGAYLKEPERRGQAPPNPMTDPNAMEGMMGMMKNNMAMIIPNTLIMSWINAFFSGYVISKQTWGSCRCAVVLTEAHSEVAVPTHHQVQKHAPGGCHDKGHGSKVDV